MKEGEVFLNVADYIHSIGRCNRTEVFKASLLKTIMKKYTIKEFAEGKKAVKIENEEQWNKLNKVFPLTFEFKGNFIYGNDEQFSSSGLNDPLNWYIKNNWEVLEFSQLDFEDEFVEGSWYKYNGWFLKFQTIIKGNIFIASETIDPDGVYENRENDGFTCGDADKTKVLLTDLSEIQQYLPSNHSDLMKKDTFVLPEKWIVEVTSENRATINTWKIKQRYNDDLFANINYTHVHYDGSGGSGGVNICHNERIITFEQFKTYVLKESTMNTFGLKVGDHLDDKIISEWVNQGNNRYHNNGNWHSSTVPFVELRTVEGFKTCDGFTGMLVSGTNEVYLKCEGFLEFKESFNKEKTMEKEILGYKLVKPEYEKAAVVLGKFTNLEVFQKLENGCNFSRTGGHYKLFKDAGVLDLWFQPVFAPDKPKLPTINGKQCVDNGDKTITCGCTTKSFDWIFGVEYAMGDDIYISDTKVTQKEIKQIVEYINNK